MFRRSRKIIEILTNVCIGNTASWTNNIPPDHQPAILSDTTLETFPMRPKDSPAKKAGSFTSRRTSKPATIKSLPRSSTDSVFEQVPSKGTESMNTQWTSPPAPSQIPQQASRSNEKSNTRDPLPEKILISKRLSRCQVFDEDQHLLLELERGEFRMYECIQPSDPVPIPSRRLVFESSTDSEMIKSFCKKKHSLNLILR